MSRNPVAVIGGGIAGLAAATQLLERRIPSLIIESYRRPGGRLSSRLGEGWTADHGCPFFYRNDKTIRWLIRETGMDDQCVAVQGPVYRLHPDRSITVPEDGGHNPHRLCFENGFEQFTRTLASSVPVICNTPVTAVRYDTGNRGWLRKDAGFWFETSGGKPIRFPDSNEPVLADGLILAVPATQGFVIARRSPALSNLQPFLSSVSYRCGFVGIFTMPRVKTPYFALRGSDEDLIRWIGFEEKKVPGRIAEDQSLMVVVASHLWSEQLFELNGDDALAAMYAEVREIVDGLPEMPASQTYKKWPVAWLENQPLGSPKEAGLPHGLWPTRPEGLPLALAGDYINGHRLEDVARSGVEAADLVAGLLPKKSKLFGINIG